MIGGRAPRGFTLFETVVVLTVFSIAVLLVVTIFTNASESQRKEAVSQKALSDARLLLNSLSQDIHTMRIDYNFYKGRDTYVSGGGGSYRVDCTTFVGDQCDLRQPVKVLALISESGEKIRYWFDEPNGKLLVCSSNPSVSSRICGFVDVTGDAVTDEQFVDTTPASVSFNRVDFYISPTTDPGYVGESLGCSFDTACTCINGAGAADEQDAQAAGGCPMWTSGFCCPIDDVTCIEKNQNGYCAFPDAQPTVTVAMDIIGEGLQVGEVSIPLQFTSTSRVYDR